MRILTSFVTSLQMTLMREQQDE